MNTIFEYIVNRLSEASTWRGIIWVATAVGLALSPEQKEAIVTAGMALAGAIGIFTRDKNPPQPTEEEIREVIQETQKKVDITVNKMSLKNEKPKKPDPDNFFND